MNITRARQETPGCEHVIHFNNAGAALMPRPVLDAVTGYLHLEAEIGGYEAAERSHEQVERIYGAVARLIGCHPKEVAAVENATRAWDMAFYSIPFREGDRILTAKAEYASNYIAFLQVARKTGAVVEVIPNDEYGQVSVEALRDLIDERVKLIAMTHVPTNGGLVNPAAEVGKVAKEAGVLYLLDACQSIGQMPVDVNEIGCDMLSATGRKFLRGPRGTGFLYIRRDLIETLEPPFLDLHAARWVEPDRYEIRSDARRFENWETNYAGKVGLGVAVDYALEWRLDAIRERISRLAGMLRACLKDLPGIVVQDIGRVQCGIISFTVDGLETEQVCRVLQDHRINVSVSASEYTLLDMKSRSLSEVVRASLHYYNTEEEIEQFCQVLASIMSVRRKPGPPVGRDS